MGSQVRLRVGHHKLIESFDLADDLSHRGLPRRARAEEREEQQHQEPHGVQYYMAASGCQSWRDVRWFNPALGTPRVLRTKTKQFFLIDGRRSVLVVLDHCRRAP